MLVFDASTIRTMRTQLNMTQKEFSTKLCVHRSTVNRWENHHSTPNKTARSGLCTIHKQMESTMNGEQVNGALKTAETVVNVVAGAAVVGLVGVVAYKLLKPEEPRKQIIEHVHKHDIDPAVAQMLMQANAAQA